MIIPEYLKLFASAIFCPQTIQSRETYLFTFSRIYLHLIFYLPPIIAPLRHKEKSITHMTTFESPPDAAMFVISRSSTTKSKAFKKSIIIACILTPSSRDQQSPGKLFLFDFRMSISI
jgi:hypothetical protein